MDPRLRKIRQFTIILMCLVTGIIFAVFKSMFSSQQTPPQMGEQYSYEQNFDIDTGFDNFSSVDLQEEMEPEPIEVVEAYHQAMARHDDRVDLDIYSDDTVRMLRNWTVTTAQMDSVASEATQCHIDKSVISGDRAVVRYKVSERECAPYFLVKEYGYWTLNLTMMQKAIRFNNKNQWHFDLNNPSAMRSYKFAFSDWRLDKHGYPHFSR